MEVGMKKEKKSSQTPGRSLHIGSPFYAPTSLQGSGFPTMRVRGQNTDALQTGTPVPSAVWSPLPVNQPLNMRTLAELAWSKYDVMPLQLHDELMALEMFRPFDVRFEEACRLLSKSNLDEDWKLVRDAILNYSLCLRGFPECPNEDLMLAVYFFFEKVFKIKAKFQLCVRFDYQDEKNVVGVLFDSFKTKAEILAKVKFGSVCSKIKITPNENFHWILDSFCGQ